MIIYTTVSNNGVICDYAWDLSMEGDGISSVAQTFPTGWTVSGSDFTFFLGSTAVIPTLSEWGIIVLCMLILIIGSVSLKYSNIRKKVLA